MLCAWVEGMLRAVRLHMQPELFPAAERADGPPPGHGAGPAPLRDGWSEATGPAGAAGADPRGLAGRDLPATHPFGRPAGGAGMGECTGGLPAGGRSRREQYPSADAGGGAAAAGGLTVHEAAHMLMCRAIPMLQVRAAGGFDNVCPGR